MVNYKDAYISNIQRQHKPELLMKMELFESIYYCHTI